MALEVRQGGVRRVSDRRTPKGQASLKVGEERWVRHVLLAERALDVTEHDASGGAPCLDLVA